MYREQQLGGNYADVGVNQAKTREKSEARLENQQVQELEQGGH